MRKNVLEKSMKHRILAALFRAQQPLTLQEMSKIVSRKRNSDTQITTLLGQLVCEGLIRQSGKKSFAIAPKAPLFTGPITIHPRGFGFVAAGLAEDVYVPMRKTGGAMHQDVVLIQVENSSKRPEGVVVAIITRRSSTVAGFFQEYGALGLVVPEDPRCPFSIRVCRDNYPQLREGDAVIASFNRTEAPAEILSGRIVEYLGAPENIDVQMRFVVERFQLPCVFSKEALREADVASSRSYSEKRKDLRDIYYVTIDGEDAKDFDDAIAVEKKGDKFRLYVSIADVSHYVTPHSALDQEAYRRGTSIYFPGRVIPMLPEKISNDLCSLVPDEDRLAITAVLDFDRQGKRCKKSFFRSIITSKKRLSYNEVHEILNNDHVSVAEYDACCITMLNDAAQLARLLLARRTARGAIGFTLPEPKIELAADGVVATVHKATRSFAHQIIEEFMLAANEAVAETFSENKREVLYRIHEAPDHVKVSEFIDFTKKIGLKLPEFMMEPEWFRTVLASCENSSRQYVVNTLLLRTMKQACYSMENKGHFALASRNYTHFTSPIRRYPDLLVHRELVKMIREKEEKKDISLPLLKEEQAVFLSGRERRAIDTEREINDRLKLMYMGRHLGENFQAVISGVTDFALFVELLDSCISGAIPLEQFPDDFYLYDAKNYRIIGQSGGAIYQIGDLIEVTVAYIDKNKMRIIFSPTSTK